MITEVYPKIYLNKIPLPGLPLQALTVILLYRLREFADRFGA
jgi:hypothetical protein